MRWDAIYGIRGITERWYPLYFPENKGYGIPSHKLALIIIFSLERCPVTADAGSTSRPSPSQRDRRRRALWAPRLAHLAAAGSTSRPPPSQRDRRRRALWAPRLAHLAAAGSTSRPPPSQRDSSRRALWEPRLAHPAVAGSTSRPLPSHRGSRRDQQVRARAGRKLRRQPAPERRRQPGSSSSVQ